MKQKEGANRAHRKQVKGTTQGKIKKNNSTYRKSQATGPNNLKTLKILRTSERCRQKKPITEINIEIKIENQRRVGIATQKN